MKLRGSNEEEKEEGEEEQLRQKLNNPDPKGGELYKTTKHTNTYIYIRLYTYTIYAVVYIYR